jgi:hypothetical protein
MLNGSIIFPEKSAQELLGHPGPLLVSFGKIASMKNETPQVEVIGVKSGCRFVR